MQAPEEEVVKVDSVRALEVMPGLHLLRGACNSRLKFEVEYNLRRGTTDNCYLLQVRWLGAWQCTTVASRLAPPILMHVHTALPSGSGCVGAGRHPF